MASDDAKMVFKKQFGYTPTHLSQAPGCAELLGSHADFHEGLALTIAVNKHVSIATSPRTDGRVELFSARHNVKAAFWISDLNDPADPPWLRAIKHLLHGLRKHGVHFGGFNAAVTSDFPATMELKESAALAVAIALSIRKLYPFRLTETGAMSRPPQRDRRGELSPLNNVEKMAAGRLCQRSLESTGNLIDTGCTGPLTSLHGKAFHALMVDCRFQTIETVPMIGEVVWIICHTGRNSRDVSKELALLKYHSDAAAKKLGAASLRSLDCRYLAANKRRLSEEEYGCAYHIVAETQRVIYAERALQEGDFEQFGQYLFESHESSRAFFKNSSPELDLLEGLARVHPGCLGARLLGPGFEGATINLLTHAHYEAFMKTIPAQYSERTGHAIEPVICLSVDGAS